MTEFDAAEICNLLELPAPKGAVEVAESVQLVRTRYISDYLGVTVLHPATKGLIALALIMATMAIGYFFGPLISLSVPTILGGLLYLDKPTTMVVESTPPPVQAPKVCLPPHLRKATQAIPKPAAPAAQPPKKTSPPRSSRAQPRAAHLRKGPQAPVRRAPPVLKGWGDVENTIREGDAQAVRDRAERVKAMEGQPMGAWTERHGGRYVKAIKEE